MPAILTAMSLVVRGGTLSGLAVTARLAKLGHRVTLVTDGAPLGTRWAATEGPDSNQVDALPQLVALPATWRDVFKKSGGHLVAELNRAGLALVEAPPVEHRFHDGTTLALPAERGEQFHAISHRFGVPVAERWRDLLDDLDAAWTARRAFGIDRPDLPHSKAEQRQLWLDRSLVALADRLDHPQLSNLVTDLGPIRGTHSPDAPALLATTLVLDRTFGRWQLVDAQGMGQRASRLVELLAARVLERGVAVLDTSDVAAAADCRPHARTRWPHRAPRAALRPVITHDVREGDGVLSMREIVEHTATGPVTTWLRPLPDGVLTTTHDHRHGTPDPDWGLAPDSARAWLRRTPIVDDTPAASACSPAGNEPWAELASAALAVYELHERLTGEDCRPTNRDFRGSRLVARP